MLRASKLKLWPATSTACPFNPFFPRISGYSQEFFCIRAEGNMVVDGSKRLAPPRTVSVRKFAEARAADLENLHEIVKKRLNDDFRTQRNKRRRTTGHDDRITRKKNRKFRKKRQRDSGDGVGDNAAEREDAKKPPRRVRRRIELRENPLTGFTASGDGTKRLRTHVWHAKRFSMTKLWGFHLPLGLQGRGRGSRGILKKLKGGVLVHDASYHGIVQLDGPEDVLLSILTTVLVPSLSSQCKDASDNILSGAICGRAMLHYVGVPYSRAIAPVTYMWRPQQCTHFVPENQDSDTLGEHNCYDRPASFRRLWILIHAAAFKEGYEVLQSACEKAGEMDAAGHSVNCVSLENQLGQLDIIGPMAFKLLRKILHPVTCMAGKSSVLRRFSVVESPSASKSENATGLKNEDQILSSAVVSFNVKDPRTLNCKEIAIGSETKSQLALTNKETEAHKHKVLVADPNTEAELLSSLCLKLEELPDLSDDRELWDVDKGLSPPVEEGILHGERHQHYMESFYLCNRSSQPSNSPIDRQDSRSCPVMVLKNDMTASVLRWSVILPLSWVKAFWLTLVSSGANAIGLREKHWIASEVGLPRFPSDFPDCNAYTCFMAAEADASEQKLKLRPPSLRPPKVPIPPPWNSVKVIVSNASSDAVDVGIQNDKLCASDMANNNLIRKGCTLKYCIASQNSHGASFEGFVARTSDALSNFLNDISSNHLLLLPAVSDTKKSMAKFMEEKILGQGTNSVKTLIFFEKRCFLRVLLHAYKEGVFEEGAVICAPKTDDVKLWKCRSELGDGLLQVPQSSRESFFVERQSGLWELQFPEYSQDRESFRWPIGFVTSGFVRGSKKPFAGAICEAVSLARLREEQWTAMPARQMKKEIYLLVRNLRSTAYRLALATIVLERREDDVDYM